MSRRRGRRIADFTGVESGCQFQSTFRGTAGSWPGIGGGRGFRQARDDDAEAMQDMARFARRVRRRLGLTQMEFARRIDVPHETIRNWEQGKRGPTGAARALLRILDKAPETALRVLT